MFTVAHAKRRENGGVTQLGVHKRKGMLTLSSSPISFSHGHLTFTQGHDVRHAEVYHKL